MARARPNLDPKVSAILERGVIYGEMEFVLVRSLIGTQLTKARALRVRAMLDEFESDHSYEPGNAAA